MKIFSLALLFLLTVLTSAQNQKVLHVSTIPSNADIYIEQVRPDHSDSPAESSPAFIKLTQEQEQKGEILLHLFHQEFNDTTIRVKLSGKDTSFLIVSLRPTYDDILLDEQKNILSKRSRKSFGHKLMFSSILPFIISGTAGIITLYQIDQAEKYKRDIDRTIINSSADFNENVKKFKDSKDNAQTAKTTSIISLATGVSILTLGFILSF